MYNPLLPTNKQLDVTILSLTSDGLELSNSQKDSLIQDLIELFGGAQDPALGTVVIDIPVKDKKVQIWIHNWE